MYPILDKIEQALAAKSRVTVIDKAGRYYHGVFADSWVRISGGKVRGKVVFDSEEKGQLEIDANDILDVLLPSR